MDLIVTIEVFFFKKNKVSYISLGKEGMAHPTGLLGKPKGWSGTSRSKGKPGVFVVFFTGRRGQNRKVQDWSDGVILVSSGG